MKKLLLMAAIGVAGLMSAKEVQPLKKSGLKILSGGYYNVAVATSCGAPYSQKLWFSTPPTDDVLQNIANAVNIALCGEEGGSETAVKAKDDSVG